MDDVLRSSKKQVGIVLLGWLGCSPRSLQKYADLYKDKEGYSLIACIIPDVEMVCQSVINNDNDNNNSSTTTITLLTNELITKINDSSSQVKDGFVIHLFSNAGCFVYERLIKTVTATNKSSSSLNMIPPLLGVIFDSAPCYFQGIESLHRAMMISSTPPNRLKFFMKQMLERSSSIVGQLFFNSSSSENSMEIQQQQVSQRGNEFWNFMKNYDDENNVFQLYLYSDTDPLCQLKPLLELINYRKNKFGRHRILSRHFSNSSHCALLLSQPYMYRLVVDAFLELCTSSHHNSSYDDDGDDDSLKLLLSCL